MSDNRLIGERFIDMIDVIDDGCWQWQGKLGPTGYGFFTIKFPGHVLAHRFAYWLFNGEIPAGKVIDHLCRNRGCVNPDHLEAVTHKENLLRGETLAAENAKKTVCPKGHAYTGRNNRGNRVCGKCHYLANSTYTSRRLAHV